MLLMFNSFNVHLLCLTIFNHNFLAVYSHRNVYHYTVGYFMRRVTSNLQSNAEIR